jgi:hypothetical protein
MHESKDVERRKEASQWMAVNLWWELTKSNASKEVATNQKQTNPNFFAIHSDSLPLYVKVA